MLHGFLLACSHETPATAVVTTGWEYHWETLAHRISYLRAAVNADTSLDLGLVGGDWSTGATFEDVPYYRMRYAFVEGEGFDVREAEVALTVGPEWDSETTVAFPDVPERGSYVALLQGFSIDTAIEQGAGYPEDYDPSYGYTSQGFGFALGEPVVSGGAAEVPLTTTLRWGVQDREDMNRAIPFAQTAVTVRVLLVGTDHGVSTTEVAASAAYPFDPPYTEQPPMETTASPGGEAADGFLGWTRWDLQANLTGPDEGAGDYLRSFGAELFPTSEEEVAVVATVTNSNAIELSQLTAGFGGTIARVGARRATVTHYAVTGSHPVGAATAPPTMDSATASE